MVKGDGFMETVAFVNISLRKYQRWPFCTKTTTGMIAINGEKAYLKAMNLMNFNNYSRWWFGWNRRLWITWEPQTVVFG